MHALQEEARADGLACQVDAVGEMLLFHCDLCGETLPTHRLHRCSRACNFDVCRKTASTPSCTRSSERGRHEREGLLVGLM